MTKKPTVYLTKTQIYQCLDGMRTTPAWLPDTEFGQECHGLMNAYLSDLEEGLAYLPNVEEEEFSDLLTDIENEQLLALFLPKLVGVENTYDPETLDAMLENAIDECDEGVLKLGVAPFLKARGILFPVSGEDGDHLDPNDMNISLDKYMRNRSDLLEEYAGYVGEAEALHDFEHVDKMCRYHVITDETEQAEEAFNMLVAQQRPKPVFLEKSRMQAIANEVGKLDYSDDSPETRIFTALAESYQQSVYALLQKERLDTDTFLRFEQEGFDQALRHLYKDQETPIAKLYDRIQIERADLPESPYMRALCDGETVGEEGLANLIDYADKKPLVDAAFLKDNPDGQPWIDQFERCMQYQLFHNAHEHAHESVQAQVLEKTLSGLTR